MSARKVAFVTGASSGIGQAAAEAFVRAGYATVLADRDVARGQQAAASLQARGECRFVACDVSDDESVQNAVQSTVAAYGSLDAAFNAAGIDGDRAPAAECSLENWQRIIAVDLSGVFYSVRHEIKQMLKQGGGSIVNCASAAGLVGTVMLPAYAAAKHGVVGLTKACALDYVRHNIRVNAVCPGLIDTPMWHRAISPELTEQLLKTDPMGRLGTPQEIAASVIWLCSEAASFVNGQAIAVDGGFTSQ